MWNFEPGSPWHKALVKSVCKYYNDGCISEDVVYCPIGSAVRLLARNVSCLQYCKLNPELAARIISEHSQKSASKQFCMRNSDQI